MKLWHAEQITAAIRAVEPDPAPAVPTLLYAAMGVLAVVLAVVVWAQF